MKPDASQPGPARSGRADSPRALAKEMGAKRVGADRRRPPGMTAALVLADGTVFWGRGIGAPGTRVGEACFNTAMSGNQEILTDPSYAGQIITFTFPHFGNVGPTPDATETVTPAALSPVRAPKF